MGHFQGYGTCEVPLFSVSACLSSIQVWPPEVAVAAERPVKGLTLWVPAGRLVRGSAAPSTCLDFVVCVNSAL